MKRIFSLRRIRIGHYQLLGLGLLVILMLPVMFIGILSDGVSRHGDAYQLDELKTKDLEKIKAMVLNVLKKDGPKDSATRTTEELPSKGTLIQFKNFSDREKFLKMVNELSSSQKENVKINHVYKNFPVVLISTTPELKDSLVNFRSSSIKIAGNEPFQMVFDPRTLFSRGENTFLEKNYQFNFDVKPVETSRRLTKTFLSPNMDSPIIQPSRINQFSSLTDKTSIPARVTNATILWDLGYKGKGITIGIADTGIWSGHPDLSVAVVRNYVNAQYGYDTVEDENDGHGHGTHVAGIAAGTGVASSGTYVGMAPEATLYSFKVATSFGSATPAGLLAAIDDAITMDVDVLSISLGFSSGDADDIISSAVDRAVDSGVVVTVSAGNSGPSLYTISSPATARKVITVGAGNYDLEVVDFSSRGPSSDGRVDPDVIAPGENVISTLSRGSVIDEALNALVGYDAIIKGDGGDYVPLSGTSMAAPVVAGAAALLRQAFPQATPLEIKAAIQASATKLTHPQGTYATGSGYLNVAAAYKYLSENQGKMVMVQPDVIEFVDPPRFTGESQMLKVSIIASQLRSVRVSVEGNMSTFISIPTIVELDSSGYGEFYINITVPFGSPEGTYVATMKIRDSQQQIVREVAIQSLEIQHPRSRILWDLWHNDLADSFLINFRDLQEYLESELNYSLVLWDEPWNLPELLNFDLVILTDPEIALTPHDREVLSQYLSLGGNLILLASYGPNYEVNSLNEFLAPIGISFSESFLPSIVDDGISLGFLETEVGNAVLNATWFRDGLSNLSWPLGSKIRVKSSLGSSVGGYVSKLGSSDVPVLAYSDLSKYESFPLALSSDGMLLPSATKAGKLVVIASELVWYGWHWQSFDTSIHFDFTADLFNWILSPTLEEGVTLAAKNDAITDWNQVGIKMYLNSTEILSNQTLAATVRIFDKTTNSFGSNFPSNISIIVRNESSVVKTLNASLDQEGLASFLIDVSDLPQGWYGVSVAMKTLNGSTVGYRWNLFHVRNATNFSSEGRSGLTDISSSVTGSDTSRPSNWVGLLTSDNPGMNYTKVYKKQQVRFTFVVNQTREFDSLNVAVFEIGEGLSSLIVRNVTEFVTYDDLQVTFMDDKSSTEKVYQSSWTPPADAHQGQYMVLIEVIEVQDGMRVVTDQQGFIFYVYEDQPSISSTASTFNGASLADVNTKLQRVSAGQEVTIQIVGNDYTDSLEEMRAQVLFIHYYFFLMTSIILRSYPLNYSSKVAAFEGTITIPEQNLLSINLQEQQLRLKTGSDQIYALIYVLRDSQGNYALDVVPMVIEGSVISLGSASGLILILLLVVILVALFLYFWQRSKRSRVRSSVRSPFTSYQQFYQYGPPYAPPGSMRSSEMSRPLDIPPKSVQPSLSTTRKFCRYCGFPIRPTDSFCGNCGKRL